MLSSVNLLSSVFCRAAAAGSRGLQSPRAVMRMNCIELSGVSANFVAPSNWRIKVLESGMAVFSPPTMEPVFPVHESTPGLYFLNAIDTIFPVSGSVTIEFSPASTVILVENKTCHRSCRGA